METYFLDLIEANQGSAVLLIPILAFAEACFGIGLFISGAFLVIVSSILYFTEVSSLPLICGLAMLGATAGDHVGFYVGYFLGPRLAQTRFAERHHAAIVRANAMIARYGAFTIFIGRFVPAIRSLLPAMIGITGFSRRVYSLLDALACCLWATALGAIVYFIGGSFQV
ncbi:MAG TPA: hypothetical protein DCS92_10755 [Gammaproteobacteria bacterium]|nr:hypothetical protein [Gammaproteobacteria bacterium]